MFQTFYENNFAINMLKSLALCSLKDYYAEKEKEARSGEQVSLEFQFQDDLLMNKMIEHAFLNPVEWDA